MTFEEFVKDNPGAAERMSPSQLRQYFEWHQKGQPTSLIQLWLNFFKDDFI